MKGDKGMTLSKRLDKLENILAPIKPQEPIIVYFCADEAEQDQNPQKAITKGRSLNSIPAQCRPTPEEIETARQKSLITGQPVVLFCKPEY